MQGLDWIGEEVTMSRLEHERKGEVKINVRERLYAKGCKVL